LNFVEDQALTKINVKNKSIVLRCYLKALDDIFVVFNDVNALDIFFDVINSVQKNITLIQALECGNSLAYLIGKIRLKCKRQQTGTRLILDSALHLLDKIYASSPQSKSCFPRHSAINSIF